MRWSGGRRSTNIEDRRGRGGVGLPIGIAGGGIGTVVLVLLAMFFGFDPGIVMDQGGGPPVDYSRESPATSPQTAPGEDAVRDFVSVVLADTEDTWSELFRRMDREYRAPRLVLFSRVVQSACGMAGSATGPFYCPPDHRVYLDTDFFRLLAERLRAPGDFAQAYVIAHEVGHHVQTLLGVSEQVMAARRRASEREGNALQVRMELQADCFAGVWAHHADRGSNIKLEAGDLDEGLRAAAAIGDDRLQQQSRGVVVPESFTHGSAEQRARWLRRGFESGDPRACDTFSARAL
jgi:predicted metalloprotease